MKRLPFFSITLGIALKVLLILPGGVLAQETPPPPPEVETVFSTDFEDEENPFTAGTISDERAFSGDYSLFLTGGDAAVLEVPAEIQGGPVIVNFKLFDQGLWIDREKDGYEENVRGGPRWGVSGGDHAEDESTGVSIIERPFLPSGAGYGVNGGARFDNDWWSPGFFGGSGAIRSAPPWFGDGGSVVDGDWQPPQPGEGAWLDVTFEVTADGEVTVTMVDIEREATISLNDTIDTYLTEVWLYGGRDHAIHGILNGIWVDDLEIQGMDSTPPPDQSPEIVAHPQDQIVDPGSTATFTVSAVGEDLVYQWRHRPDDEAEFELIREVELPDDAGNLLENGDFSGDFDEEDGLAAGWSVLAGTDWEAGEAEGFDGGTAQLFSWPEKTSWGPILNQNPGFERGATYHLFLRYKTDPDTQIGLVVSNPAYASWSRVLNQRNLPSTDNEWMEVTYTFTVDIPDGESPDGLAVRIEGETAEGGTAWIDEVELLKYESVSGPELVVEEVTEEDVGLYSVIVSNPHGETASNEARLSLAIPPVIVSQPEPVDASAGEQVTFSVEAEGGDLSYQWMRDGSPVMAFGIPEDPENLLTNPFFEEGFDEDGVPDGWSVLSGTEWSTEQAEGYEGSDAVLYSWPEKTSWGPILHQAPGFERDTGYMVFMRFKTEPSERGEPANHVSLQVTAPNFAAWSRVFVVRDLETQGEWREVAYTFITDIPEENDPDQLFVRVEGGTSEGAQVWVDEVSLFKVEDTAKTATLVLDEVGLGDAGDYTVEVSNPAGTVVSDPATLRLTGVPSALVDSEEVEENIWMSDWFGLFYTHAVFDNWINSADHGWIYVSPFQPLGEMWVWDPGVSMADGAEGYVYVTSPNYPYMYIEGLGWAYFSADNSDADARLIYVFSEEDWVEFGLYKGPMQWD